MKNKIGNILLIAGTALILVSICMLGFNLYVESKANKVIDNKASKLKNKIKENKVENNTEDASLNSVVIDGDAYIGLVYIDSMDLCVPVLKDYSYDNLNTAPCLYSGSIEKNDLVIAGHSYKKHFKKLNEIKKDTEIRFVDINNHEYKYKVFDVEILSPDNNEYLVGKEENSNWDLTLFTCTKSGASRCVVRCIRCF